jgi:hypothetical protein
MEHFLAILMRISISTEHIKNKGPGLGLSEFGH